MEDRPERIAFDFAGVPLIERFYTGRNGLFWNYLLLYTEGDRGYIARQRWLSPLAICEVTREEVLVCHERAVPLIPAILSSRRMRHTGHGRCLFRVYGEGGILFEFDIDSYTDEARRPLEDLMGKALRGVPEPDCLFARTRLFGCADEWL